MTTVTQKINTFVLGMSDQPDELKQPGQVVDLKNGIPDVTQGLIKRPGSNLVQDITSQTAHSTTFAVDTGSHTKWFNIYTSNDEQYIGQVSNTGSVKICANKLILDWSSVQMSKTMWSCTTPTPSSPHFLRMYFS